MDLLKNGKKPSLANPIKHGLKMKYLSYAKPPGPCLIYSTQMTERYLRLKKTAIVRGPVKLGGAK